MQSFLRYRVFQNAGRWYSMIPYAIILITFLAISNINLKKDYGNGSMEADGKGYYAYLPAVFIYHDLSFGFYYTIERKTYNNPSFYYAYLREYDGKIINKYYAGTALCMMPFFAMGHLTTLMAGYPADGYSYYYMLWVHLGALFYLLAGILALRKLLRTYGISEKWIALALPAIVFGTNLFFYVLTEYSMSHVYSFAAITAFLLCMRTYFLAQESRYLLWSGILLGIIALIRPLNLVILLSIPFIAGDLKTLLTGFLEMFRKKLHAVAGFLAFLVIVSIQLIIYRLQTGSFFVYSYPGEGFNFLHPHMADMLFSYRKGLFVYTPLLLLSHAGFVYLWRQSRFSALSLAVFLLLLTYLLSTWHMWFYGGSFSQRVFIDFFAFFAILLGLAFQHLPKGRIRNSFITIALLLTLFCQFQTYQYRHMVIHWSDMTKEKYWDGFMKLNP